MNENVLDLLLYLFENFSLPDIGASGEVRDDLGEAGFFPEEIDDAFDWLDATRGDGRARFAAPGSDAVRVYVGPELMVLDAECRGYITRLEQAGVLNAENRELVIDRLMALAEDESATAELEQVKWVVMMVLSQAPDQDMAYARMEAMMHADTPGAAH
ncbi:DUF494 family protein [Salinisphaera sp. Q1T1-3]|uniref:DUF494 family protein n=1 Tax=Salinisphaera sp. Q1T1-3 TaxID=2321229 RepID=UPI000E762E3F|nr:DUF494 domain-containing protein [Salinisphaera sp. Q1T1-3]RJS91259.1 DUF494 domain-containing protein [Salinisphaera sp. Q1T1-3]